MLRDSAYSFDPAPGFAEGAQSRPKVLTPDDEHLRRDGRSKGRRDTELIQFATEIKVRAERKCGELLAQTEKNKGAAGNPNGQGAPVVRSNATTAQPTLADMGITKDQSSRYQSLASMSEAHFETAVATAKDTAGEVTTAPE